MTTYYSTAFTDGVDRTAFDPALPINRGPRDGGRVAYKRAFVDLRGTAPVQLNTQVQFFRIESGDRPLALFISSDGAFFANFTIDLGLWEGDFELRRNIFRNKEPIDVAVDRVERLSHSGLVVDENRGITAWEMSNAGGGTQGGVIYAHDPKATWNISGWLINLIDIGTVTDFGGRLLAEMYYLPESG